MAAPGRNWAHQCGRTAHGGLRRKRVLGKRSGVAASAKAALPITITVTAGKPTEFGFKLSKTSGVPVGKVIFKVTNKGKIPHSFKICNSPNGGTANTCVGIQPR